MRKIISLLLSVLLCNFINPLFAEDVSVEKSQTDKYTIEISISNIPDNQQTLYIPVDIDSSVLDFDKVALDGIASQNILPVAASSKDKVGPGIGLLKLDDKGLPSSLKLKVYLKPVADGTTSISLGKVADTDALPVKGAKIRNDVKAVVDGESIVEVTEKQSEDKKKLSLNKSQLALNITRQVHQAETIFIPLIFDRKVFDIDETFGHAILAPGISAKSFSSGSLNSGGPGIEIVLGEAAEKDFSVTLDLAPKGLGTSQIVLGYPQEGHTAIITGPVVEISPSQINVAVAKSDVPAQ